MLVVILALLATISLVIFCFIPETVASTKQSPTTEISEKKVPVIPQVLLDISWCESRDRQFNPDGSIFRGVVNPKDVGRWQINEYYWLDKSKELGFDIYTEDGNRDMALWIYNKQGVRPWVSSAPCHNHYE